MEAEDGRPAGADRVRTVAAQQDAGADSGPAVETAVRETLDPDTDADAAPGSDTEPEPAPELEPDDEVRSPVEAGPDTEAESESEAEAEPETQTETEPTGRKGRPVSSGIGCAALLLPLIAVAGAILCFAAGILSTVTGCTPNGSALCSANGPWFEFALPLFVSPIIAAAAAIAAVTVRRHRSSWLAVGYGIVFVSIIVGLASASTGSS